MTHKPAAASVPPGGTPFDEAAIRWNSWSLSEVARRLHDLEAPWAFAAGWALDMFRGATTREHEDVEIAIPKAAFAKVREMLQPFEFDLVGSGMWWRLTDEVAFAATHQTWLRDPATGIYVLDVFREPHDGDTWIFRRDHSIRRPYSEVVRRDRNGFPYVAPEIVLLFKARLMRPKDERDFEGALPLLDREPIRWLGDALKRVHPGHPWIERLSG